MPFIEAVAPSAIAITLFILLHELGGKSKTWVRWAILIVATVFIVRYLPWRFFETVQTRDPFTWDGAWIWFLFAIECIFIADLIKILLVRCRFEDRSKEADLRRVELEHLPADEWPSVDVYIPTYNEPRDVLERSIIGALNLDYPRFKVFVLDDGDRDWLRDLCEEAGAGYITRTAHTHAKAGNINHALQKTTGDLVAVFDADFVPYRWFLKRTVGFFNDPEIGIVQTPQHFFNRDPVQRNLWIADRWPDEQRLFFDYLALSLDGWDSMFCCGSCAVMRRKAIDAIGGIPTQSITEDILTTLEMLRAGYHTRYLNERLSVGLAAESLDAFYVQRERWCQGGIQTLFLRSGPLLGRGMTFMQRILLFPIYWTFHVPARLLILLVPIVYFWFGLEPLDNARSYEILFWQIPVLLVGWASSLLYYGRNGLPILNDGAAILVSLRLTPIVFASFVRPFGRPFKVTPKGSMTGGSRHSMFAAGLISALICLSLGGLWLNVPSDFRIVQDEEFLAVGGFWTAINVITLTIALLMCFENPVRRVQERFPVSIPTYAKINDATRLAVTIEDISLTGVSMIGDGTAFKAGQFITIELPGLGMYQGRVARVGTEDIGVDFEPEPAGKTRRELVEYLYTSGIDNAAHAGEPISVLGGLITRLWGERKGA